MTSTEPSASVDRDMLIERLRRVYDIYRTALLNRKYYAYRLTTSRRWNIAFEFAVAIGTSGAIGTWAVWKTGAGEYAWTIVAGAAAIVAVLKPILQLPKAIERYSKLYVGYSDLYYNLQQLVSEIRTVRALTEEMSKSLRLALDRYKQLAPDGDPKPTENLRRMCYEEVKRELPASSLWIPS